MEMSNEHMIDLLLDNEIMMDDIRQIKEVLQQLQESNEHIIDLLGSELQQIKSIKGGDPEAEFDRKVREELEKEIDEWSELGFNASFLTLGNTTTCTLLPKHEGLREIEGCASILVHHEDVQKLLAILKVGYGDDLSVFAELKNRSLYKQIKYFI